MADNHLYQNQFREASELHQKGHLNQAIPIYQKLTQEYPNQAEPYHRLAIILLQSNQFEKAEKLLNRAIQLNPDDITYLINFGESLNRQGKYSEAVIKLQKALQINPETFQARKKLAKSFREMGDYSKAIALYETYKPQRKSDDLFFQLGTLYLETGQLEKAKSTLHECLKLNEKHAKGWNNLAIAHQESHEYDQALKYFKKALMHDPKLEDANRNMALLSSKTGAYDQARLFMDQLAAIRNNDPLTIWARDMISPDIFQSEEEVEKYRIELANLIQKVKGMKIRLAVDQLHHLDIQPSSVFIYHGKPDRELKEQYAQLFDPIPRMNLPEWNHQKPHVGFVVTHGHEGVFIKCMKGIIERLSREKFDITLVSSFPNGPAILRENFQNPQTRYLMLQKDMGSAVKLLVRHEFDFLYYWEIGTDIFNYFLPFFKPARVQATSWGWPTTSGNREVDYFISSKYLDNQESQAHYTEKLVLFDHIPTYYESPEIPEQFSTKAELGFPESGHIYLVIQNLRKIQPSFDAILDQILTHDDDAHILLLGDKMPQIDSLLLQRLKKLRNSDRIKIIGRLSRDPYLSALHHADVILDTTHYTGGANTNYDCFAVGTPVVTIEGDTHRSRFTSGIFKLTGITELICRDAAEYVDKALQIANDSQLREKLKARMLECHSLIFEDDYAVSELEDFILKVTQKPVIASRESKVSVANWDDTKKEIEVLLSQKNIKGAIDKCTHFVNTNKDHLASRLSLARIFFDLKDKNSFELIINQTLKTFSTADDVAKIAEFNSKIGLVRPAISIYEKNIQEYPEHFESLNNLGALYLEHNSFRKAIDTLKKAESIKNDFAGTYINLGLASENLDLLQEARQYFQKAADLTGNSFLELHGNTLIPQIFNSTEEATQLFNDIETELEKFEVPEDLTHSQLIEGLAVPAFGLTYLGIEESSLRKKWASFYEKIISPVECNWQNSKPRIGFTVTLNHIRIFAKAHGGIVDQLDRSKYDLFIFCNDGEPYLRMSERFENCTVVPMPTDIDEMIRIIKSHQIDVMNYWETGSDTFNFLLPIFKPAKVQAQLWGTAYTTGSTRVDCYVSSRYLETGNSTAFYSEKELFLMETPPTYYPKPLKPPSDISRGQFDLPTDEFWYVCPQNLMKMHPDFDAVIKAILTQAENSILILLDDGFRSEKLKRRLESVLNEQYPKVRFLPRLKHESYISLLHLADVSLDPIYFTGANSSYDALGAGLPVVTFPGPYQRTRYTQCFYEYLGIEGLSAKSLEQYIDISVQLYRDKNLLIARKEEITSKSPKLFEDLRAVEEFERFLDQSLNKIGF